jgi:hypothetical protein
MARRSKDKENKVDYNELHNAWTGYSKKITDKINTISKERAEEYESLYNLWNEYSQKMTERVSEYSPKDNKFLSEMQKVWSDYSEKIGERFVDIMEKENGPYKELYETWNEYNQKVGPHIKGLVTESIKEQGELYEIWMDAFGMKDQYQMQGIPENIRDMGDFWRSIMEKSMTMSPPIMDDKMDFGKQYKELFDIWSNAYSKTMRDTLRSSEFAETNGNILNSNLDMIRARDQLSKQYLSAMGLPTKENLDDIYKKLHELDKKVSDIHRILRSQKTAKKK